MGYFAITSDNSELVIKKTSETLFVRRKDSIVFFEIEIENIENIQEETRNESENDSPTLF